MSTSHHIYIVQCSDGTFYTGYAVDIDKRIEEHNGKGGARYTRGRGPVKLMYFESYPSRSAALKREYEIKQLTRTEKQHLINQSKKNMA